MRGFRLTDSTATERLLFPEIFAKPVMLEFDERQGSSEGGAVLLKRQPSVATDDRQHVWLFM